MERLLASIRCQGGIFKKTSPLFQRFWWKLYTCVYLGNMQGRMEPFDVFNVFHNFIFNKFDSKRHNFFTHTYFLQPSFSYHTALQSHSIAKTRKKVCLRAICWKNICLIPENMIASLYLLDFLTNNLNFIVQKNYIDF